MPARFQLVIDCKDPEPLARFWAAALGYVLEPPPEGFATWDDWRRDIGLPDSELGIGADSIIDPRGEGPRIWFHVMPDAKVVKNRLHLDIHASGFPSRSDPLATRMQRVRRRGQAADGSRGHAHRSHERRRPRSLRGGDEGPRGQRVRHQLTPSPAGAPRAGAALAVPSTGQASPVARTRPGRDRVGVLRAQQYASQAARFMPAGAASW